MRSVLFPSRQWNLKVLFAFSQGQGAGIIWLLWFCYKLNDLIKDKRKKTSQLSRRKHPEISAKCNCILYVMLFRAEKQSSENYMYCDITGHGPEQTALGDLLERGGTSRDPFQPQPHDSLIALISLYYDCSFRYPQIPIFYSCWKHWIMELGCKWFLLLESKTIRVSEWRIQKQIPSHFREKRILRHIKF